jgi:hypothetical protein
MIAIKNRFGKIDQRFSRKNRLFLIGFDALGGFADALPPPRGHPPHCDDAVLPG